MTKLAFRTAILISVLVYLASYFLPFHSFQGEPAAVNLLKLDGYGALFKPEHSFFSVGVLILWLVASAGLWHFDNWARHLFLLLTAWSLVSAGLYGIRVSAPIDSLLGLIVDLLDGAILALAYLSPLRDYFVRDRA